MDESQIQTDIPPSTTYLSKTFTLSIENALIVFIALAATVTRLWDLGARVMSHDEGLHVYYSWLLATGNGYTHNPMMHGPALFEVTSLIDRLFGASDFTSRLFPAILGIFIVVVVPQLLKPWLGRTGAIITSILLLISPFILFYSRYIRHDLQVIAWTLLAVFAIFRYLSERKPRDLFWLAASLALMISTMEVSFIYMGILASFLILRILVENGLDWKAMRQAAEFDLLVVLATLGAFFSSPIALLGLNPIWSRVTGSPYVSLKVLDTQGTGWTALPEGQRLYALLIIFSVAAIAVGLWWNARRWVALAAVFLGITLALFTTFGTNASGFSSGLIGSLGYWLSQHEVARGAQPWYYFFLITPLYEYLPLIGGLGAGVYYGLNRKQLPNTARQFIPFLLWWAVSIYAGLTLAGEKMPWHVTHLVVPWILLSGWWIGQLIDNGRAVDVHALTTRQFPRYVLLFFLLLLALLTLRTSYLANYVNYDYSTEFVDYAHGAPGIKWLVSDLLTLGKISGEGKNIKVAYDNGVAWPFTWYMHDFPGQAYFGDQPNRSALDATVVVAGRENWDKVERILQDRYRRYEVIRMWWPIEDYKGLTWDRIRFAISNPAMRSALWQILWNRNYAPYAQLTNQSIDPPRSWPLYDPMRIYIKREIADQAVGLLLGAYQLADLPPLVDQFSNLTQVLEPEQLFSPGLSGPRGLAIGPDNSVFVVDTGNARLVQLDSTGNVIRTLGGPSPTEQPTPPLGTFKEPWGVAVDSEGNVYIADTWNHRIQKFSPSGGFLLSFGSPGLADEGLDRFWGPRGIAIDPQGKLYITDTGNRRVVVFDGLGTPLFQFGMDGEGMLNEPVGIAIGPDGNIYVADTWNMQVVVFTPEGQYLKKWPVPGWTSNSLDNKPYLAIDAQGRVYVTDPEGYRVMVFSSTGQPLAAFGQYGPEPDAFGLPNGIAVDQIGRVWVADAGNNRIGVYTVDPLWAEKPKE